MGITIKKFVVKEARRSSKRALVDFMIDSGAVYSLVPQKILKKLGIRPYRKMEFILADGAKFTRKVGDAYFEYQGEGGSAPVIFGEKDDEPLLGATTLESIGLVLNPFKRELYPMRMVMAKSI
ncbi:MAG: aspartyl protease [Bacteroidota bacterium]